jgi:hypothetical protein
MNRPMIHVISRLLVVLLMSTLTTQSTLFSSLQRYAFESRLLVKSRDSPPLLFRACRLRGGGRGTEQYSFSNLDDVPTAEELGKLAAENVHQDSGEYQGQNLDMYMASQGAQQGKQIALPTEEQQKKIEEAQQ